MRFCFSRLEFSLLTSTVRWDCVLVQVYHTAPLGSQEITGAKVNRDDISLYPDGDISPHPQAFNINRNIKAAGAVTLYFVGQLLQQNRFGLEHFVITFLSS